jgi:SAM-dependent methyltransferase
MSIFCAEMPPGLTLNLGAGPTGYEAEGVTFVNVDHVAPVQPGPGWFVVADTAALPFRSYVFDGMIAKDLLEHVEAPIGALTEMRRVASDEAKLLVTVPRAIPRAVWADPTHIRGFTEKALVMALEAGGWRSTRPRRIGGFPGAGRLRLTAYLEHLMRVPGLGHWFGLNWLARARPA